MKQDNVENQLIILEKYEQKTASIKSGAGYFYILWGACLAVYYLLLHLTLLGTLPSKTVQFTWLLFPMGGIASIIVARKLDRQEKLLPTQDHIHKFIWAGISVALIAGIIQSEFRMEGFIFETSLLIAVAVFITGGIFRFTGGIICGLLGVILSICLSFSAPVFATLLAGCSLLVSLVLPGILMVLRKNVHV